MEQREDSYMKTVIALYKSDTQRIVAMRKYVSKKQAEAKHFPDHAKIEATDALIRTGVVTKHGNPKKKIVSWE